MGVDFFCNDDHKRSFCVCWCTVLLSKLFGEISIMRYTSFSVRGGIEYEDHGA